VCVLDANGKDSAMRRNLRFRKTRKEGDHDVEVCVCGCVCVCVCVGVCSMQMGKIQQ
jgi:hypothetical protein